MPGIMKREGRQLSVAPAPGAGSIYLSDLKSGDSGIITTLNGCERFRCQMLSLGIVPGVRIAVVNGGYGRPFILKVKDARLILSWGMVKKIAVSGIEYS